LADVTGGSLLYNQDAIKSNLSSLCTAGQQLGGHAASQKQSGAQEHMSIRPDETNRRLKVRDLPKYLLGYVCWVVTAAVTMLSVLLIRNSLNVVWPLLGGSRWVLRPIDRFGLVLMGLGWLVFVLFLENYYRTGVSTGLGRRLRPEGQIAPRSGRAIPRVLRRWGLDLLALRFVRTLAIPLALAAVAYLGQQVVFLTVTG
jgi:hypothetical protein